MSPRSARASQTEPVSKQNKDKETTAEARSDQQTAREVFLSFLCAGDREPRASRVVYTSYPPPTPKPARLIFFLKEEERKNWKEPTPSLPPIPEKQLTLQSHPDDSNFCPHSLLSSLKRSEGTIG